MPLSARRGVTLVEMLVALTIGVLLCGIALGAVRAIGRTVEGLVTRQVGERSGAEVIDLLETLGRHLRDPQLLGDTALQGALRIGAGVVCRVGDATVALAPAIAGSTEVMTILADPPAGDDRLDLLTGVRRPEERGWESARVVTVGRVPAPDGCGAESAFVTAAQRTAQVLVLTHTPMAGLPSPGSPAELYREIRLVPYRDGQGDWMIGLRSCVEARCGPPQPMAGPIRSPREMGLRIRHRPGNSHIVVHVRLAALDRIVEGVIPAVESVP